MTDPERRVSQNALLGHLGVRFADIDAEHVVTCMAVTDRVRNSQGSVHAGVFITMADATATVLARQGIEVGPQGEGFPLCIDLHTVMLRNVTAGEVTAEARVVRRGRRVTVIRTVVSGEDGRTLAEVTTTHIPA